MLTLDKIPDTSALPYLGEGCYGKAMLGDDGRVVKLGPMHDGALAWYRFCQLNQGRKYVPRIHVLVLVRERYLAIMDKLEGMRPSDPAREEWEDQGHTFGGSGSKVFCEFQGVVGCEIASLEAEFREATGCNFDDLHDGNFMWHPEYGLTITDPCSSPDPDWRDKLGDYMLRRPSFIGMQEYPQ